MGWRFWDLLRRPRRPKPDFGKWGECQAARYLRRNGYRILLRNVRIGGGEIDLVCRHGEALVFVEVKARRSTDHGEPAEAVDAAKRARLVRAAYAYLAELGREDLAYRFDIVEVLAEPGERPLVRLHPDAFGPP